MNFGTKLRTVLTVATSLNTALIATDVTEFGNAKLNAVYKAVSIILNFVIVACATYYNNDFTESACRHTGEMRLEKAQKKGTDGEDFTDEEEGDD